MGAKDFFKNISGMKPDSKGVIKDNLDDSLVDVESSAHAEERLEEKNYLLPDIDYSEPANFVKYGLAYEYYNNAFIRIRTQYPYDGSAAEKLAFYNDLTPLEKYVFDQKYPKYNGFVTLGLGTYGGGTPATFGTTTNPQYIRFYGGPHEGNVINVSASQENNLHLNLQNGFTVEFWLKKNGAASTLTQTAYENLLNIRNEDDTQRFFLFINGGASQNRIYYYQENWNGATFDLINNGYFDLGITVSDNTWRHFAFSFKKQSGASVKSVCYVNGQEVDTNAYTVGAASPIYTITGSVVGTINGAGGSDGGSPDVAAISTEAGYGKPVSASYDEFRIWKTERTGKQIGLNWFRNVHGGTNTDSTKYYYKSSIDNKPVDLSVYFKFNEGIISSTGTGAYDAGNEVDSTTAIGDNLVIDYSGRISNGVFVGYDSSLSMRSESSAIVLAEAADSEEKDPLLFIENTDYSSALTPLLASGSAHDLSNPTALYSNLPQWIREDDIKNGSEIKKLLQIMGSYFDTVHAQIEHLRQFREAKYINSQNKTTDYISSLLKAHGFNVPELFVDPDVLASIYDQDEKRIFEEKLFNLKNKIYKNIYTNLVAIYKAKGTEKGFRNLFRCYGTDDELFKINLYADGVEYQIDDKTYDSLVKKRLVDFSGFRDSTDRNASVYQRTTVGAEYGYYPSSSNVNIPMTIEAQIVFPNKPDIPSLDTLDYLPTASLFGVHSSSLSHTEATVPASDCDFQVQTRRNSGGFTQFVLTSSTGFFPVLTSSFFYDEEKQVYDDVPWNIAVRLYPKQYPFSSYVTQSEQFTLNFYGVKNYLGTTFAEFDVSTDITKNKAGQFLTGSNKRFYIGADKVNFSGSVNYKSDVKFARFMVWNSYLTNDEITKHARNPKNYGFANPYQNAFTYESSTITSSFITKGDTLALSWEFDTVEDYNDKALDSTSGSAFEVAKYPIHSFGSYNGQNYPGHLDSFASDKTSTVLELMQGNIIQRPDALYGKNMVEIKDNDYESFKFNKKPVKMFFAFEASQNEVISRDMLNFFGDVISFNNLYGEAVHEFRDKYKELDHFKRFYFSKVDSVSDIDKFVNLYKFLDNALDSVIGNLVPASAATSEKIRTVVEDHTLDRHKVQKPYPLLIQVFEDKLNEYERNPGAQQKTYPCRSADVNTTNVDTDNITFPDCDNSTPLINDRTVTRIQRQADIGTGLGIEGRREVQRNINRVSERTRLVVGTTSTLTSYVYSNKSQEKDKGDLLIGDVSVDTVRTQIDINNKFNNVKQLGSNFSLSADYGEIYGLEDRGEVNILNNKFSNTSQDGYKLLLTNFPMNGDFLTDITDKTIYGPREYSTTLENRETGEKFIGSEVLPKEVKILSSSTDIYGLLPEKNFEIEYINHDSVLGSISNKTQTKQLFASSADRKELFSLGLSVPSSYQPVQIYFTSPQITFDSFGTPTFSQNKPTNLVRKRNTAHVFGPKLNYNWSGRSAEILAMAPTDYDVLTLPSNIQYTVADSTYIEDPISAQATYDRVAISRSINENEDAFYNVVDRGIFRDRTDVETEQISPNANVNYKNLIIKRAIRAAYSTPTSLDNSGYLSLGASANPTIHNSVTNPYLEINTVNTESFVQDYDNGYIIKVSQNNYDQRWHRSSNMVRLSETNNSPYINRNFYSTYSSIIGKLTDYSPLTTTNYSLSSKYTIPHDEETVATTTFGTTYVDFSGLNIVTNRNVSVIDREINATSNNYINPKVAASIATGRRIHYYLANSNGPFAYSLERTRLNYAGPVLRNERYRNSFSYDLSEIFDPNAIIKFDIIPVYSKSRPSIAIIQDGDRLEKIKFEVFYPSIQEYFDESTYNFVRLPRDILKPILESEHNRDYSSIFSLESQKLNNFVLKYFSFAEQVFPRAQKSIRTLINYETDTNFLIDQNFRKTSQAVNSLGKQYTDTSAFEARIVNTSFSSWATETFPIVDFGSTFESYDGELVQMNYEGAYTAFIAAGPYVEQHYNQTFGYRINHKNRNDSSIPTVNLSPYKYYETMLSNTDIGTRGIIAEYCSKNSIEDYFNNGCTEISSEPSLFGHDYSSDSKKLLGLASYSDEVFTLKDIHKQIDRF